MSFKLNKKLTLEKIEKLTEKGLENMINFPNLKKVIKHGNKANRTKLKR